MTYLHPDKYCIPNFFNYKSNSSSPSKPAMRNAKNLTHQQDIWDAPKEHKPQPADTSIYSSTTILNADFDADCLSVCRSVTVPGIASLANDLNANDDVGIMMMRMMLLSMTTSTMQCKCLSTRLHHNARSEPNVEWWRWCK